MKFKIDRTDPIFIRPLQVNLKFIQDTPRFEIVVGKLVIFQMHDFGMVTI